jgi:hypothetical protein
MGIIYNGFATGKIDFDVVTIESVSLERVDGLIERLLGREKQPSPVRIVENLPLVITPWS